MLTDARIRKIKPEEKTKRYADEKGMYLEVTPSGGMYWRLKYRVNGKENRYSMGVYGEVSLAEARVKRDDARKLIAQGIDPNQAKKQVKAIVDNTNCFEVLARKWLAGNRP
jgi:hypothetical protein